MNIVLIRTVILYVLVIFAVRIMGKRQIGELQPSELVITILVSNIATLPLEDLNIPIIMGILPVLALVCLEVIMSWVTMKWKWLRQAVSGVPKVIIRGGVLDRQVMKDLRFSVDDLMAALRGNGVFDIKEVQYAVVETNGSVSVYQKHFYRDVTNEDLNITGADADPPVIIAADGKVIKQGLSEAGMGMAELKLLLRKSGVELSDVFLLLSDGQGNNTIIRRSGKVEQD